MKYGIREICDVVLKAKANNTKVGNKRFDKGQPVLYFDSLKTSTMEGAATTVYAQGGRGNSRLVAWEGERTVTFTMEDALISELGLAVLTGAGIIDGEEKPITVHATERAKVESGTATASYTGAVAANEDIYAIVLDENDNVISDPQKITTGTLTISGLGSDAYAVMFDFYTVKTSGTKQIEITPDKFAGNYYLEASTLFRSADGVDHPAEFIIPNCKIQSNFTFTMASSGDPSTFTFTMDAFPDYTKFDPTKKVLSVIQIIGEEEEEDETVTVSIKGPDTIEASSSAQLTANTPVKWTVTGTGATINQYTGYLTTDETATGEITVTATSTASPSISDTHTITVVE